MIRHILAIGGLAAIFGILGLIATSTWPLWISFPLAVACVLAGWWVIGLWRGLDDGNS